MRGEPKFYVDGTTFDGGWLRPQNDGPCLRSIALVCVCVCVCVGIVVLSMRGEPKFYVDGATFDVWLRRAFCALSLWCVYYAVYVLLNGRWNGLWPSLLPDKPSTSGTTSITRTPLKRVLNAIWSTSLTTGISGSDRSFLDICVVRLLILNMARRSQKIGFM